MIFSAVNTFVRVLSDWQRSEFQLIKIHDMSHYRTAIIRSGSPFEFSSNLYENLHIALMKRAYRASNKRDFQKFIIKYNRRLQALRTNVQGMDGFEKPKKINSPLNEVCNANIFN